MITSAPAMTQQLPVAETIGALAMPPPLQVGTTGVLRMLGLLTTGLQRPRLSQLVVEGGDRLSSVTTK